MCKRAWSLFMALILSAFILVPSTMAERQDDALVSLQAASDRGDTYPSRYRNAGLDEIVDEWNFYNRECTSFVAWCLNSRNGIGFHNRLGGIRWGNAGSWDDAARTLGYPVDTTPAVGAVAYCNPWSHGTGENGHVAWVSEVNGDDVSIEEYNHNLKAPGTFGTRTVNKYNFDGFIHIKDIIIEPVSPTINLTVVGTEVDITWSNVGADSYYIYVQNVETQSIPYGNNVGKSFSIHLGLSEGKWRVYVTAVYSADVMRSSSRDFGIGEQNLIPDVDTSVSDLTVDISWNDVGASSYYVYVRNIESDTVAWGNNVGLNFSQHLGLSKGRWQAVVTAVFSADNMKSGSKEFVIGNYYRIEFNACGGTVDNEAKTILQNDSYGQLPTPTRDGFKFQGWYTEEYGGLLITEETKAAISTDQTLYAHWTQLRYGPEIDSVIREGTDIIAMIYCDEEGVTAFCGVYSSDGQMIALDIKAITESGEYIFKFTENQFDYAKVILLKRDMMPLCCSVRA